MYELKVKIPVELRCIEDNLFNDYTKNYCLSTVTKRSSMRKAIKCFIRNTYDKHKRGIDKVGITLDRNSYSNPIITNGISSKPEVSYTYTKKLFDFLVDFGYVDIIKGGVTSYGIHKGRWCALETTNSFLVMNPKLQDLYDTVNYQTESQLKQRENVVIVKVKGKETTFRMMGKLKHTKRNLDTYNSVSVKSTVKSVKGFHDTQIYKIYLDKTYNLYGRNHMSSEGIQQLSKEDRRSLVIDEEDTVIYDYGSFEPSIAYTLNGEVMPEDCYKIELDGYDEETLRKISKKCLLVMLNIRSTAWEDLRATCNHVLSKEMDIPKLVRQGLIPERIDVSTICSELSKLHEPISNFMCGRAMTDTTYVGSLICDYVTDYFAQRDILVLSVFDEFIIQEKYDDLLPEVMKNAYEFVCGSVTNCKIRKEK